jgi:polyhydroxyalkanoate synthesis regulator phasin
LLLLLWLIDYYYPTENFAASHARFSNEENRVTMLSKLSLSQLVEGAAHLATPTLTAAIRTHLWKDFMQYTTQSTVTLPVNVNRDIEKHIVQHRCKLEMVFLSKTRKNILTEIVQDLVDTGMLPNNQALNLKQDLCATIQALNDISRDRTKETIRTCLTELHTFGPDALDMTQAKFDAATAEVRQFLVAVDRWDDASSYYLDANGSFGFCDKDTDSCFTNVARLHATAAAVKNHAKTCTSMLSKARKEHLKTRSSRGERLSFRDKLRTWF